MRYKYLLAKRSATPEAPRENETLVGHVLDVVAVAKTLVHEWGKAYLDSMGLPQEWMGRLLVACARGALLHDLGKASHQFQRLVRAGPGRPQALRHEWISLFLVVHFRELRDWLFPDDDALVQHAAAIAAVGHHLEFPDGNALRPREGSGDTEVVVMTGHGDIAALLDKGGRVLGLQMPSPQLADVRIDLLDDEPLRGLPRWVLDTNEWWDRASVEERRFVALVKALVLSADLAGSVLPRAAQEPVRWVTTSLGRTCSSTGLQQLATARLKGKPLRDFQRKVVEAPARITVVRAGCGNGKTTAAYLWSARHAIGRKLFFCYPTTGTSTEGYKDYALADGVEIGSALIHSRAEVDLETILGAPDADDEQLRFEALAGWDVPLVVCTADTVLGLAQNNRRGLFVFPCIANAAFVFDEIHAYDERMFGALLRFIEAFPTAPILLMTASLQKSRLEALRAVAASLKQELTEIEGARELELIPRYRLQRVGVEAIWPHIEKALRDSGHVLWVVNTVSRAVKLGQEAVEQGLDPVLLYHSRFRYLDRVSRHKAVIEAFRNQGPILAVTTQVCEVSLDISADLLITELAPVPSLMQRLGRLNRYATPENTTEPRLALVLEPGGSGPYDGKELKIAQSWLDRLGECPLSQTDLARTFLDVDVALGSAPSTRSAWLDGGPFSDIAPLREAGQTIPVIRAEDAHRARDDRREVIRLSIPMLLGPVAKEIYSWPRLGSALVAPLGRINYSKAWGAAWQG